MFIKNMNIFSEFRHHCTSMYQAYFIMPGSCQMEGIIGLYNYVMIYLTGILFFVTTALLFIINTHLDGARHVKQMQSVSKEEFIVWLRYVKSWTHSTPLELFWTILPTIILLAIAIPSFILLYALDEIVDTQCVVKVIGYQWFWKYEYPINLDEELEIINVSYFSYMIPEDELSEKYPARLLEADMPLVIPHTCNVKIVVTAKDVIHSFAVPGLGVKMDGIPGRLNQVTVFVFKPGVYFGQCSELCGVNHAFMPIVVHAISFDVFEQFLYKILEVTHRGDVYPTFADNWEFISNYLYPKVSSFETPLDYHSDIRDPKIDEKIEEL